MMKLILAAVIVFMQMDASAQTQNNAALKPISTLKVRQAKPEEIITATPTHLQKSKIAAKAPVAGTIVPTPQEAMKPKVRAIAVVPANN